MAAGDRNKAGKPTDIVRHYKMAHENKTYCGRKKWGYATSDLAKVMIDKEITCNACLRLLKKYGINNVGRSHKNRK